MRTKKTVEVARGPVEYDITVEGVKALPIGSKVNIHGEDADGVHRCLNCIVAGWPQRKFLTYRDDAGTIRRCQIKEYPGKYYMKVV